MQEHLIYLIIDPNGMLLFISEKRTDFRTPSGPKFSTMDSTTYSITFKVLMSTTRNIFIVLADVTSSTISVWGKLKGHLKSYKKLRLIPSSSSPFPTSNAFTEGETVFKVEPT